MVRVVLNTDDLRHLFRGGTLRVDESDTEFIIPDIGYARLQSLVCDAIASREPPPLGEVREVRP